MLSPPAAKKSSSTPTDGKYVHSSEVFAAPGDNGIALYTEGGSATFSNLTIRRLRDINPQPTPSGTVLADFDSNNYGTWTPTGTAFGTAPATGTLPNQQTVSGYLGNGLVNTYLNGDASTGTLTSPAFTVNQHYLKFLIAGGNHPDAAGASTAVNLIVDGRVVRTATGVTRSTCAGPPGTSATSLGDRRGSRSSTTTPANGDTSTPTTSY